MFHPEGLGHCDVGRIDWTRARGGDHDFLVGFFVEEGDGGGGDLRVPADDLAPEEFEFACGSVCVCVCE